MSMNTSAEYYKLQAVYHEEENLSPIGFPELVLFFPPWNYFFIPPDYFLSMYTLKT